MTHRQTTRRVLGIAAATLAGALALGACTPSDDAPAASGTAPSTGAAGNPTGTLEIIWPGTSDPETRMAEDFAKAMAAKGITIEYNFLSWADIQKQLAVRIQAGDPPDLTMTQDVTDLVRMDGLLPLDDLFAKSFEAADFRPGTLEVSTVDGSLYAVPYAAQAFDLVVNETMLSAAGYAVEDLKTWDDVVAAAKAMTKDGAYGFGFPLQNPRFAFRGALTMAYTNDLWPGDDSDAATTKWIQTLEHAKAMNAFSPPAAAAWSYPEMFQAYSNGEVGMIPAGTFFTANVYELNPEIVEQSRQIAYPAGPSGTQVAPVSNTGFGIFKDSPNHDLAWYVIEQLVSPEWVGRLTTAVNSPALAAIKPADLADDAALIYPNAPEGHAQQMTDQAALIDDHGTPLRPIVGQPALEPEFQAILLDFFAGKITADDAHGRIATAIKQSR
ncbi:ABC transporter substrate-binding protein [Sanguibacter sp. A247]|uniref:ABC transporter substrate-binding protein n=1 Tax=unclassified Sanguibacter TaxID=2645534 RepID=UPI003FD7D06C